MTRVRLQDIGITFAAGGTFLVRAPSAGVGARVPGPAIEVLSFCSEPRTREEVGARYGPMGLQLFDGLAGVGLLVDPAQAADTPVMFANFSSLDVHRRMLGDRPRMDAYADAIAAVVEPGMAVLDAGTGSGILAGLAAAAGARIVYAVDHSDMIDTARQLLSASGFGERVVCLQADLATVELPEQVDVIVTETFGAFGLAEGGIPDLRACAARNLAPGGRIIPEELSLHLAPVTDPALLDEAVGAFRPFRGVALDSLRPRAFQRGITTEIRPDQLVGAGLELGRLSLRPQEEDEVAVTAGLRFGDIPAPLTGLAGWFDLHLGGGVVLSTGPRAPATHWKQQLLPLDQLEVGGSWEVEVEVGPALDDRRGCEVTARWDGGAATYRLR